MKSNRLISEKSPYLLQHAYNPVDWYPWGQEAFDLAEREKKPVFLSIGYATCHWCHVMEKESFEDMEVAALLNEAFICIKVDREERPDIDHLYMSACQLFSGSGGWPLTVIMTPDRKPFFAGTYFPKKSIIGRIGLTDLIPRVKKMWADDKIALLKLSEEVIERLKQDGETQTLNPSDSLIDETYDQLGQMFDNEFGGFSEAPKFPSAHILLFLLEYGARRNSVKALEMATKTLDAMRLGGIYDHLGSGFHRYSTDSKWLVPHFEKMLYDQAMLVMAYSRAFRLTGDPDYSNTVNDVLGYVQRDMTSPDGGFYSAEDADSEGEEGRFYVWTNDEIMAALDNEEAAEISSLFNIQKEGNFIEQSTGSPSGFNILHMNNKLKIAPGSIEQQLLGKTESAIVKLFNLRSKRPRPFKDDKILTDWNGLMIAAFASASRDLNRSQYAEAASKAADFILSRMRTEDGRLLHRFRGDDAAIPGFSDDYAFFISGLIELHIATSNRNYLEEALTLNRIFISHYWDTRNGGFFFTSDYNPDLPLRRKEIYDGAIPSGNSVALHNLVRLAKITGNNDFKEMAIRIASSFSSALSAAPAAYASFIMGLDMLNNQESEGAK